MNNVLNLSGLIYFLLIFSRTIGITILNPIFSRKEIPYIIKIGVSLYLALIVTNSVTVNIEISNIAVLTFIMIKEFVIGLIIGFVSYLFFNALYIAGEFIDMSMGFGIVNVLDIQNNIQVPIMGNFIYILSMLIFLSVNGHYYFLSAVLDSYKYVPIGVLEINENFLQFSINIFTQIFVIGFKISAPIVITLLLTDVALGILSRTVPQMNVFMVGMPLKVFIGVITMIIVLPMYIFSLDALFNKSFDSIYNIIRIIGGKV